MYEEQFSTPVVRIRTFGPLVIEWLEWNNEHGQFPHYTPLSPDKIQGKDVLPARSLLKLLLCRPGRFALRDWIMEQFWPDMERNSAIHRFDNVLWTLRRLLCPPDAPNHDKLRTTLLASVRGDQSSGIGYRLASYPLIWVDADAFEWYAEQAARSARFGDDPLPFWVQAYELGSRGSFLADEIYSEWTTDRRHLLTGLFRQCVSELSRLLIARGLTTEAEMCLRRYVVSHPTDEDVLRPLMELLGKREHYQELLDLYQTCETELAREDRQPDSRTQDIQEYFKSKQIRRARTPDKPIQAQSAAVPSPKPLFPSESSMSSMLGANSGILLSETLATTDIGTQLRSNDSTAIIVVDRSGTVQAIHKVQQLDETGDTDMDRRSFFRESIEVAKTATSIALFMPDASDTTDDIVNRFIKALRKPSTVDTSTLSYFERCTATYWQDRHGALLPSDELLSYALEHFNRAVLLLENPMFPSVRARLCSGASEIAQLVGHLLFDMGDYAQARKYHKAAIIAAQEADNVALQAVAWARMSFTWTYSRDPQQALEYIQNARQFASSVNTTVRAYLAAVEAEIQAVRGEREACFKALEDAEKFEERQHSSEESYWLRFDYSRLVGYQGACFRQLYHAETMKDRSLLDKSQRALTNALEHLAPTKIQRRPLLLIDLASVYAKQNAVKEACDCASQAMLVTTQLKSQTVVQRLLLLQSELKPWQDTSYVRNMNDQITSLSINRKGDSRLGL